MTTQTLTKIETEVSTIIPSISNLSISTEEDKIKASSLLVSLTLYLDRLTADRELITKPINASLKAIRAKYKPLETILESNISTIRQELSKYQTKALELQREKENKIADRVGEGKGYIKAETAMNKIAGLEKPTARLITDDGVISFRTDTVLSVTDISLIPREYFILDESRLLKDLKNNVQVSGAELKEVQTVITKR